MINEPHSTVVGDVEAFDRMCMNLSEDKPALRDFLDLTTLIEYLVLNEEIVLFDYGENINDTAGRERLNEILEPLISEQVIRVEGFIKDERMESSVQDRRNVIDGLGNIDADADGEEAAQVIMEASSTADLEIRYSCPGILLTCHQPIYESNASIRKDHAVCDLSTKYLDLRKSLEQYRSVTQLPQVEYRNLPIPPIANSVYEKCSSIDEAIVRH